METWEKLLPNQNFNSKDYASRTPIEMAMHNKILDVCEFKTPSDAFDLEHTDMFTIAEMASGEVPLSFICWLIGMSGARRVLEIGSFIGVSTMCFARALPEDGQVTAIEKFDHFADIAELNFKNNNLDDKIDLLRGDAKEQLSLLDKESQFDIAFIDGNKENYAQYMEVIAPLILPGGLIIVDDVFYHGDALNDLPASEKGEGARKALALAKSWKGWGRSLLPISNGILLLSKPR